MSVDLITCPHCRSEIPHGANVCKGCRAEIAYGTPPIFFWVGVILPVVASLWMDDKFHLHNTPFEWVFIIPVVVVGWFFFYWLSQKLFSKRINFTRRMNK